MERFTLNRRRFLATATLGAGSLALAGCDPLGRSEEARSFLQSAEGFTEAVQRLALDRDALAPEFSESEIIQPMRPNGTTAPRDADYRAHAVAGFADWRLVVDGLVERPLSLSLNELRNMPARTQITRHDCVEGWSCIAKWTGVPLSRVLDEAGVKPAARYAVFHSADTMETTPSGPFRYYESVDMIDARHPQTILAYGLNGRVLPVSNGAPLRVRIERQLGYKSAKYIMRVELTDRLPALGRGRGSYWADKGYEWYAGI